MSFLLHRKVTICMLFAACSLLGYISYRQLPVELLPNAELPLLFVQAVSQQDMNPSYVESEVIIPLESAIFSIQGVDRVQSVVDSRQSYIQIEFKKNIPFSLTSIKLQDKINEVARTLPDGFAIQVQKVDIRQLANTFMTLQVRGSGGVDRLRNMVEKEIRSSLENIDGVAAVQVYGGREKAIEIRLDPDACEALDLTPAQISRLLSQNTQEKTFAGYAHEPGRQYFVHVNAPYAKASDLENIAVSPRGDVKLKDIATVIFDVKEETTYSRVDGKEAVSVLLQNDSQANLIELSHRTLAVVEELNRRLSPQDVDVVVRENTAETMEKNINQIIRLALIGGLLAVAVLWVFLRQLRLVFFIALSIPISVYTAFNFFYAAGISINTLTLAGMALAIGMLLDNSVVVLENIYRLSGMGYSAERSVVQGTQEVWRSILAATLTTITVFLPFVFSDNFLIKLIGHHIGVSIISTLAVSLFVALLFVPMGTYALLRRHDRQTVFFRKVSLRQRAIQIYLVLLKTCMRHPGATLLSAVALLFTTLGIALALDLGQMKEVETNRLGIYVSMQTGSTLEHTDLAVRTMEERLADFPEKKELSSRIQEREAVLTLELKDNYRETGKRTMDDIRSDVQRLLAGIHGAEVSFSAETSPRRGAQGGNTMGGTGNLLRLLGIGDNRERMVVRGADFDLMRLVAEDFRYHLEKQSFVRNVSVSYSERQPELLLGFDPVLLNAHRVTLSDISSGLMALNNDLPSGSSFRVADETYDILIRNGLPPADRQHTTTDDLRAVQIQSSTGARYPLHTLATMRYSQGRSQILRVNQDRQIELFYNFSRDVEASKSLLEEYRAETDRLVADYHLPSGVAVEVFHEEDLLSGFRFLLLAAFVLIFMILAAVFESVATPFVLLFSIPLAAIGSLAAIVLTGNSLLNANTLTGFLILLGIVVNNSILLIDYANILHARGYRRNRALIAAGLSRVRPILITAITTIVAMLPLAMGDTEYVGAIGSPFAVTVIGGLAFSALLTLVLVPAACLSFENALRWYRALTLRVKLTHLALFLLGLFGIYRHADGLLWQLVYLVALVVLIPWVTYFVQNSLRRANAKLIHPSDEIRINIRNLVKVYHRPGRFLRQWNSGLLVRRRLSPNDALPDVLRLPASLPPIYKPRKPFKALRGVSFEIKTGMFGLLGPNGAGKSTLMRIVCGILDQSYGSIWINGLDTRIYREELQSLTGFLPQEFGAYEQMTAREFLDYQAILRGITDGPTRRRRIEYVLKSVHMYERRNDRIASFSGGMKQRVGIALILLHLPRILVVDEPTAGLDPRERIRFRNLLSELSRERIVIFSTHIIEDISASCSQVAVLHEGRLKYFGHPSRMIDRAAGKVWSFRLGKEAFEALPDKSNIIRHIPDEEGYILVRYLSTQQPRPDALAEEPNLEDAYLCLLKNT
jgi:multidrug efflux pump subunit AcrB/ABC-type multidrug transport system ATPase subunit